MNTYWHYSISNHFWPENMVTLSQQCCRVPSSPDYGNKCKTLLVTNKPFLYIHLFPLVCLCFFHLYFCFFFSFSISFPLFILQGRLSDNSFSVSDYPNPRVFISFSSVSRIWALTNWAHSVYQSASLQSVVWALTNWAQVLINLLLFSPSYEL